jgi:ribonuclease P protein component
VELKNSFNKALRLRQPYEFKHVFQNGSKLIPGCFVFYVCINDLTHARLGLSILKKAAPLANTRNRLRRIVRESFRLNWQSLPGLDIVVCLFKPTKIDNCALQRELKQRWLLLIRS